tara:strand:+ start:133 stop:450 length:318 start_codon:yes stop_codon:yes gene_type:complete
MFTQVTETIFRDMFQAIRPDNFTRAGLVALFDHLENLEDDTGEQVEFDVIGLCCDFTEYANWAEFNIEYGSLIDDEEIQPGDFEKLQDHTTVICFGESSFIIRAF